MFVKMFTMIQELDSLERVQMAELGDSPEYRQFLQVRSPFTGSFFKSDLALSASSNFRLDLFSD
jgi:hypothetical protein